MYDDDRVDGFVHRNQLIGMLRYTLQSQKKGSGTRDVYLEYRCTMKGGH